MELSFWEYKTWLTNVDYTIVGSGIVGLNCALALRAKFPKSRILILEKGVLPQGASTKNAGFACFGSISEILADLRDHSEEEVVELVEMRWKGIHLLRNILGDQALDYETYGGHEVFSKNNSMHYEFCLDSITKVNELLQPVFGKSTFVRVPNEFNFLNVQKDYITNPQEAQINTGKMMNALLNKVRAEGIEILNTISVKKFNQVYNGVEVETDKFDFKTRKLFLATNGFAHQVLDSELKPARAQVLITEAIPNLHIKGTFHMDEGYYYFRNVENRILFGGARNLNFEGETTDEFGLTDEIQNRLEKLLAEVILPDIPFEVDRRWSGIMGMGDQKRPILRQLSDDVYCGVRLGGMGIAIGSLVGNSLADLMN